MESLKKREAMINNKNFAPQRVSQSLAACTTDQQRFQVVDNYFQRKPKPSLLDQAIKKNADKSFVCRDAGNKFLERRYFGSALRAYNESIALAPENSEALYLAFANRSAVLLKLERPLESLKDVDRAIALGYPDHLLYKLLRRRARGFLLLGKRDEAIEAFGEAMQALEKASNMTEIRAEIESEIQRAKQRPAVDLESALQALTLDQDPGLDKEPPPLSYGRSGVMPCASDCLGLSYSAKLGRHYVATRDIELGDVLMVDRPLAGFLHAECFYTHCSHCLRRSLTLQPCPKCAWAMFCSPACASAASRNHRIECTIIPVLIAYGVHDEGLLVVRLVATFGITEVHQFVLNNLPKISEQDPRTRGFTRGRYLHNLNSLFGLARNSDVRPVNVVFTLAIAAKKIVLAMRALLPDPQLFGAVFLRLLQAMEINAFHSEEQVVKMDGLSKMQSDTGRVLVAVAIHPCMSLFSHSCAPNAVSIGYSRGVRAIRPLQPIKQGSVVTIAYSKHCFFVPREERQLWCRLSFNFVCECEACQGHWPLLEDMQPVLPPDCSASKDREAYGRGKEIMQSEQVGGRLRKYESLDAEQVEVVAKQIKVMWKMWKGQPIPCQDYNLLVFAYTRALNREGCVYYMNKKKR